MAVEFNSAANLGLSTGGPNLNNLLDKLVAKELARLKPTQDLKEAYKVRFDAWKQTKSLLEKVSLAADPLIDRLTWTAKKATSSDPDIVTAQASATAVPGRYPLIVDKVASYHQMGSQLYAKADSFIGNGTVAIGLVDERPLIIKIDQTNNTLQGLADAINNAKIDVSANVVKLSNDDFPYQLILTSKRSGKDGKIVIDNSNLVGGNWPDFRYRYTQPSDWVFAPRDLNKERADDKGASSTVPIVTGTYKGIRDLDITFTALNTGRVGGDDQPIVGWKDNFGRSGRFKLGKFDYAEGTKLDLPDGLKVSFSEGDLVLNDTFHLKAKPDESKFWWVPDSDKASKVYKPTPWAKQITEGLPVIGGELKGEDNDTYHLKVTKGGIIGATNHVLIDYTSDNGDQGTVDVGLDYKVGTPVAFGKGLTLTLQKGTLQKGFTADFSIEAPLSNSYWWLFGDGEDSKKTKVNIPLGWSNANAVDLGPDDLYDPNSRRSNAIAHVVGEYTLDENKTYKVTVHGNGTVGTSDGLYVEWDDGKGKKGQFDVGRNYSPGSSLRMEGGLSLQFDKGYLFNDDYFTFTATSPTIVPAQDSEIRLNPLENKQGGLRFTSPTNQIKNAIEGVVLDLHKAEDKVVVITIEEDKAKAKDAIAAFVKAYNEALVYIQEAIKYDPETKVAGPLQAEYQLANVQDALRTFIVDAIPGLPRDANTLPYAGVTINKKGTLDFDESKLDERLGSNYEKVANIFRNIGTSQNSGVIFINSSVDTVNSGEKGYDVQVTKAATQGFFKTQSIDAPMNVVQGQNKFKIEIDGKSSQVITLDTGPWTLRQISKKIANEIRKEPAFNGLDVDTQYDSHVMTITSGTYGATSSVKLLPVDATNLPFFIGQAVAGENVEGNINNHPAQGNGRLLTGNKQFPEKDLRLLIALRPSQVTQNKPEANIVYTIGKGGIVKKYLNEQLKEKTGTVDTGIKNVSDRIQNLDERLVRGAEAVARKKDRLSRQFSNVEARLSQLNAVKQDITSGFRNTGA